MSTNGTKTNDVSAGSPLPAKDGATSGSVESLGFKELLQGMNALQDNVRSQLPYPSERQSMAQSSEDRTEQYRQCHPV